MNTEKIGVIQNDDVRIIINEKVYKQLHAFAQEDTRNERGSFLIGKSITEDNTICTYITGFIEAKHTEASPVSLTFTHETWNSVHQELTASHPNEKIVGWQHTHPGLGVFMSSYDMFIHENYFDLPFLIALVIDPIRDQDGFFQWKNGKVEKLHGFYLVIEDPNSLDSNQKFAE